MRRGAVGEVLADVTAEDAQLLLSLLVWPAEAPDPRVVDEWVRRHADVAETDKRFGVSPGYARDAQTRHPWHA
jgi:hypothetical protein